MWKLIIVRGFFGELLDLDTGHVATEQVEESNYFQRLPRCMILWTGPFCTLSWGYFTKLPPMRESAFTSQLDR